MSGVRAAGVSRRARFRSVAMATMLFVGFPLATVGLTAARASADGAVTIFKNAGISGPQSIAAAPDGTLWFTNGGGGPNGLGSIGRISTTGAVTVFTDPGIVRPEGIALGHDGAFWFANNDNIGRITTAGSVTYFSNPSIVSPLAIAAGPDGAVWFTNGNNSIGRIGPAGRISHFSDPGIQAPVGIVAGPDGALWFTNPNSIGRITTTGVVTTYTNSSISFAAEITVGTDGALWFTNLAGGSIGRITTSGVITSYAAGVKNPGGIAAGPDGALWYTAGLTGTSAIGRMTTAGVVTNVQTDPGIDNPVGITAGHDGALWFTSQDNDAIGRITTAEVVVPGAGSVAEGNSATATLQVPVTLNKPSTQTITAQWKTVFAPNGAGPQADPANDYTPASGTVTFAPGQTTAHVSISIHGDTLVEPNEYIVVEFGSPTNARIGGVYGLGFGTITNDD